MPLEDLTSTSALLKTFLILLSAGAIIAGIFYSATHSNFLSGQAATTTISQTIPTPNSTLENGLVGHWTFDGPTISSTTVADQSGNGNNGTLTGGPTPVAGQVGQGRGFNGSSQYVSVSNSASLNPSYLTLSAWVKVNSLGTYSIIRKGYVSPSLEYFLRTESTGKITGSVVNASLSQVQFSSNGVILAGQWQFVTVTYDGSYIKIYINGIFDSQSAQTGILNSSTGVVGIGYRPTGNDQFLNGFLDDTRIYSRALSPDEIYQLYHLGKPDVMNAPADPVPSLGQGLVGYWKFDEGTGSSTVDSTGRGMTGTLTGNPTWTGGQINNAVNLDGTGDYVSIADNAALDVGTGDFTYSFWLNPDVINQGVFFSDGSYTDGIMFYRYTDNYTYLWLANTYIQTTAWAPTASVWQHVVVRRTSGTVTIFADGVLKYTTASLPGSIDSSSGMRIGYGFAGAANAVLDGKIDEFRMYNRALSDAEILELTRLNVPTDFDSSLVGYWSFNGKDISGTTAYDRSGKGNNGTLTNGPAKAAGTLGQALFFDNTDDYVTIADNTALDFTTSADFTLSGWFRREAYTTDDTLIAKRNGIANTDDGYIAYIDDADDKLYFEVSDIADTDEYSLVSTRTFTDNDWHQFSITWDDDNATNTNLYIDGSYETTVKTGTLANIGDLSTALAFRVGAESDNGNPFAGKLDDVRIYNRALTAAEVYRLYSRQVSHERSCGTVTDRDGNIYGTIKIDTQCWMAQNLRVGTRVNIVFTQTNNSTIEKWCYSNLDSNCTANNPNQPDGGLYQWNEAMGYSTTAGAQGICPTGFHIPTDAEQYTLENYLKNTGQTCNASRSATYDCSPAGTKLKAGGPSRLEFNLAGVGFSGSFVNRGIFGFFWSSSESGGGAWYRFVGSSEARVFRNVYSKSNGLSVRCLQD